MTSSLLLILAAGLVLLIGLLAKVLDLRSRREGETIAVRGVVSDALGGDPELFEPLVRGLLDYDPYFVLADFPAYLECQRNVGETYRDRERWTRMSIRNCARTGKFSSDRTIREYCRDIWRVEAVPIGRAPELETQRELDEPLGTLHAIPAR